MTKGGNFAVILQKTTKIIGTLLIKKNLWLLYTLTMNYQNIKKANPFIIASKKNKISRNKK